MHEAPRHIEDTPGDNPEDEARRAALKAVAVLGGALYAGLYAYPAARMLASAGAGPTPEPSSVALGQAARFSPGTARHVSFGAEPVIVRRDAQGGFHAFSAVCTHLGCTVGYNPGEGHLFCACHGAVFHAESGQPLAGPAREPLPRFAVEEHDGELTLRRVGP